MDIDEFASKVADLASDLPDNLKNGLIIHFGKDLKFYHYNPDSGKKLNESYKEAGERLTFKLLRKKIQPLYFEGQDLFI